MAGGVSARLTPAAGRKFGLTLGIAFTLLATLMWWRGHDVILVITGGLGAMLLVAARLAPTRLGPVERVWMGLAHAISMVTTPIFMGIVYFLVIAPIGSLVRRFGRNPLVHAESQGGFWANRSDDREGRGGMDRQF